MFIRPILRFIGHQKWLRFGLRDRVIRAFHNPDKSKAEAFKVNFFGYIYPGNFATFLDWNVYYFGAYSEEELILMKDSLKNISNPVILDVGANVGHHSLFASTIAEKVYAFEPYTIVGSKIHEKIQVNSIINIYVQEVGLGETNGDFLFATPDDCNTGTGSFTNVAKNNSSVLTLPIRKGDDYLASLKLSKIDFIKIDVEGFEPQVLQGLQNTLASFRPIVFFEWSINGRKLTSNADNIFPPDYRIYNFHINQVVFKIFNKSGYHLDREKDPLSTDGNKIAIPIEKINNFSFKS